MNERFMSAFMDEMDKIAAAVLGKGKVRRLDKFVRDFFVQGTRKTQKKATRPKLT